MSLDFLLKRRSVVARLLEAPGPSRKEVEQLIRAAIRVPDHKALAPWRFAIIEGEARAELGQAVAAIFERNNQGQEPLESRVQAERDRFLRAPLVITVISSPTDCDKVPEVEQILSAGAACQNVLHAANALGFAAQWVTEWVAYDKEVHRLFAMSERETIAGYIYVGTSSNHPAERQRVEPDQVVTYWNS